MYHLGCFSLSGWRNFPAAYARCFLCSTTTPRITRAKSGYSILCVRGPLPQRLVRALILESKSLWARNQNATTRGSAVPIVCCGNKTGLWHCRWRWRKHWHSHCSRVVWFHSAAHAAFGPRTRRRNTKQPTSLAALVCA